MKKGPFPQHPPPDTAPPLLYPLPARENAASNNNQERGEEQDDAKVRRRLCGTSEIALRLQCCVPFLGICPPTGCIFQTGKSDDSILRHFYLSKKFIFVVFSISGTLCIDL